MHANFCSWTEILGDIKIGASFSFLPVSVLAFKLGYKEISVKYFTKNSNTKNTPNAGMH